MAGRFEGDSGGILGLREFIREHEEAVTADLFDRGLHISDIGETFSWFEFRCWIKWLPEKSAVVRLRRQRAAEEAVPEEARTVGRGAIPIDEMDAFLGWNEEG